MITDPVAIQFANSQIRPAADKMAQAYYSLKSLVDNWNYQNMASLLAPGDQTILSDGSQTDGRPHISADDCYAIILRAQDIITLFEASNNAKLASIIKVAPHTT